jgi:hypothetical protein
MAWIIVLRRAIIVFAIILLMIRSPIFGSRRVKLDY